MARIRSIKPEFFLHEEIAELPPLHRLLFIGLWTVADRRGRMEDRPRRIKASVLPYDDVDLDSMLKDLSDRDFIVRYEVDGARYIAIPAFEKHQRVSGKEAQNDSTFPPPPDRRRAKRKGSTGEAPEKHLGAQERSTEYGVQERSTGTENGPGADAPPMVAAPAPSGEVHAPAADGDVAVYARWRELWSPTASRLLTDKRRKLIRARRSEREPSRAQQDLLDSLAGWRNDPWPDRKHQASLEILLRDAGQVDKGLQLLAQGPPRGAAPPPPMSCIPGCMSPPGPGLHGLCDAHLAQLDRAAAANGLDSEKCLRAGRQRVVEVIAMEAHHAPAP